MNIYIYIYNMNNRMTKNNRQPGVETRISNTLNVFSRTGGKVTSSLFVSSWSGSKHASIGRKTFISKLKGIVNFFLRQVQFISVNNELCVASSLVVKCFFNEVEMQNEGISFFKNVEY